MNFNEFADPWRLLLPRNRRLLQSQVMPAAPASQPADYGGMRIESALFALDIFKYECDDMKLWQDAVARHVNLVWIRLQAVTAAIVVAALPALVAGLVIVGMSPVVFLTIVAVVALQLAAMWYFRGKIAVWQGPDRERRPHYLSRPYDGLATHGLLRHPNGRPFAWPALEILMRRAGDSPIPIAEVLLLIQPGQQPLHVGYAPATAEQHSALQTR